ncbi:hypothetical protein IE077_003265 [Cardiosporidium cionae]|uniref:Serine protease n=1 Tax=Cardiosporidium cionae TaxID=476202 RepID=A0ABQ7J8N3_9APIC|nr:hypothetical protein IE077_003265 [Cardiosporidium cionae]|eukprot:KAF8820356.1 hypothetical protein IE077_003265 [Cardiosporidium cionae]
MEINLNIRHQLPSFFIFLTIFVCAWFLNMSNGEREFYSTVSPAELNLEAEIERIVGADIGLAERLDKVSVSALKFPEAHNGKVKNSSAVLPPNLNPFQGEPSTNGGNDALSESVQKDLIQSHFQNQDYLLHGDTNTLPNGILQNLLRGVFRIHSSRKYPDFGTPWQIKGYGRATGTGFSLANRTIVTNAHVVSYADTIHVEKPGIAKLFIAEAIVVAHEPDIALLTVADESFWEDLPSLKLAEGKWEIPRLLFDVMVIGYPTGGETISVTKGVVSRVQVGSYAHSTSRFLEIQIDAAINPGNSGGPVVNNKGDIVGIAFQGLESSDNIGYIIPVPVVKHVLEDVKRHKRYTGIVTMGASLQSMENPNLRSYFGLNEINVQLPPGISMEGSLVISVDEERNLQHVQHILNWGAKFVPNLGILTNASIREKVGLQRGDIIVEIDGVNVAQDGTIRLRGIERVSLDYLLIGKYFGEYIPCTVIREKKVQAIKIPLETSNFVIPKQTSDEKPRYLICGGLVFVPLTRRYILDRKIGRNRLRTAVMIEDYSNVYQTKDLQELVVLSRILPSHISIGYHGQNLLLKSVNGQTIKSLQHLQDTLDNINNDPNEMYISFSFGELHEFIVVNKTEVREINAKILKENGITASHSEEL